MFSKILFFSILAFIFGGCVEILTTVSPLSVVNVYDAYSIAKDEREISQIAKDKIIKTKIQAKILASSGLSNMSLDVESFYADVYLIGVVPDLEHKNKLIQLAQNTSGVQKIYTYIRFADDAKDCKNNTSIMLNLKNKKILIMGCGVIVYLKIVL